MDALILTLGCLLGLVSVGGYLGWCWALRPPAMRRRVIVNTIGPPEMAFRGVWWSSRGPWIVLKQCELLQTGAPTQALDGDVVIHRGQISFVQRLAPD